MNIINSKTIARIAAVQVTYQLTTDMSSSQVEKTIMQMAGYYEGKGALEDLEVEDLKLKIKLHKNFFNQLCTAITTHLAEIDKLIILYLSEEWSFENLHISLKAILRSGVAELMYFPEIPSKVILNEYTNIASDMLKNSEVGFINSILDTINKEIRKNAS